MAEKMYLGQGQTLIQEGQTSTSMYMLVTGTVEISKMKLKQKIVLGHAHSGELIGEISFLDEQPRTATVIAVSDCELLEIPRDKFMSLLKKQPQYFRALKCS